MLLYLEGNESLLVHSDILEARIGGTDEHRCLKLKPYFLKSNSNTILDETSYSLNHLEVKRR
jgi:hypothetical protein